MLELIRQHALELEMAGHLGAEHYERTDDRLGYRNGYKPRTLYTAVGTLNLLIPQDRDGTFSTTLFCRYQRSDKALVLAIMEMYVKGVSTRKVADITEKLCGRSFPSQQVSKLDQRKALFIGSLACCTLLSLAFRLHSFTEEDRQGMRPMFHRDSHGEASHASANSAIDIRGHPRRSRNSSTLKPAWSMMLCTVPFLRSRG